MLYQIAIYGNTTAWESVTERDAGELARAHAQVVAELTETGELVAHHELDLDEAVVLGPGDTTTPGVLRDGQWVAGGDDHCGVDLVGCVSALDVVVGLIGCRFSRSEPRVRAGLYVRGHLAGLERKNGWTLNSTAFETETDSRAVSSVNAVTPGPPTNAAVHVLGPAPAADSPG